MKIATNLTVLGFGELKWSILPRPTEPVKKVEDQEEAGVVYIYPQETASGDSEIEIEKGFLQYAAPATTA